MTLHQDKHTSGAKYHQDEQRGRRRNLALICFAFLTTFVSINAVTNLQSSINVRNNVGLYSLAIMSVAMVLSSLFLSNALVSMLGYKWSIVSGQVGILLYVVGNVYPESFVMYPGIVLLI